MTLNIIKNVMSLEAMKFQFNGDLHGDLTREFSDYRQLLETNNEKPKTKSFQQETRVAQILSRHTGMTINMEIDESSSPNAYVLLPDLVRNNSLFPFHGRALMWRGSMLAQKLKKDKDAIGTIDKVNGSVTGVFSEVVFDSAVTAGLLTAKGNDGHYRFTPDEISAIVLHEMGHLLTYLESLSRTMFKSWILESRLDDYRNAKDDRTKIQIIEEMKAEKLVAKDDIDSDTLVQGSDEQACTLIVTKAYKEFIINNDTIIYDLTSAESAADQFAVRMGAGTSLVSALGKMYHSRTGYKVAYAIRQFFDVFVVAASLFSLVNGSPILGAFMLLIMYAAGYESNFRIYDLAGDRMKRIKQEMIGYFKDYDMPAKQRAELLASYDALSDLENAGRKNAIQEVGILEWTARVLTPSLRRNHKSKEYQQLIESLQNNELYVLSARFANK